jgi:hypothetical protein
MWLASAEDDEAYDEAIRDVVGYFRLYCGETFTTISRGSNRVLFASTSTSMTPKSWLRNYLAREYFEEFSTTRFKQASVQQRHRLLFQFAMILAHELAHVVGFKRCETDLIQRLANGLPVEPEVLFEPTDVTSELGHAWESWAFGGTMFPTGQPLDVRGFGLRWYPWLWPGRGDNLYCLDFPCGEFIVHASTMSKFFSTTGWQKHANDDQPLVVELTPLRAFSGFVEDRKDDDYAKAFRLRLHFMHHGRTSASIRNYTPKRTRCRPSP